MSSLSLEVQAIVDREMDNPVRYCTGGYSPAAYAALLGETYTPPTPAESQSYDSAITEYRRQKQAACLAAGM